MLYCEAKMKTFSFIDKVVEVKKGQSLTALFTLHGNEEFLKDHFPGFPIMPGVLLLESLKQAGSELLRQTSGSGPHRLVDVQAAKFGQFVKPGTQLKLFVQLVRFENARADFEGRVDWLDGLGGSGKAISANFALTSV